jgi:hypothetical protein
MNSLSAGAGDVPPPVIDCARVISYSNVDSTVSWTGRQVLYVGNDRIGPVPKIAICQNLNGPLTDFLLCFCDEDWHVKGVTTRQTVEELKETAERWYSGISSKWVDLHISREEAESWFRENKPHLVCAFCERIPTDYEDAYFAESAAVCFDCVRQMHANLPEPPN